MYLMFFFVCLYLFLVFKNYFENQKKKVHNNVLDEYIPFIFYTWNQSHVRFFESLLYQDVSALYAF